MGIHFEKKHQEKIRELGNKVNFFQTYRFSSELTPEQRKEIREVSYELIEIANHYEIKRKYTNQDRRINYKTNKLFEGTK